MKSFDSKISTQSRSSFIKLEESHVTANNGRIFHSRIIREEKKNKNIVDDGYLFPKRSFQNSAASALVMRNWSPAKVPVGNIALSSDSM